MLLTQTIVVICLGLILNLGICLWVKHRAKQEQLSFIKDCSTLNRLIKLAVLESKQRDRKLEKELAHIQGLLAKEHISGTISKKLAERSFALANTATVSMAILQRGLQTRPPRMTSEQLTKNEVIAKKINEQFGTGLDFAKPFLTDDEIEILEFAQKHSQANGEGRK